MKCEVCGETELEGDLGAFEAEAEDGAFVIAILETSPKPSCTRLTHSGSLELLLFFKFLHGIRHCCRVINR